MGAGSRRGWEGGRHPQRARAGPCLPGGWRAAIRAGRWGRSGRRASGQAHHTEHLWAGFMGESLGQWKARPNSSNWDTLPSTLEWERRPTQCGSHRHPAVPPHPDTRRERGRRRQVGIPVVLRCVLVSQHLQVDGLRPPLDAPVLGPGWGCGGGEWEMRPGVSCPSPARPPHTRPPARAALRPLPSEPTGPLPPAGPPLALTDPRRPSLAHLGKGDEEELVVCVLEPVQRVLRAMLPHPLLIGLGAEGAAAVPAVGQPDTLHLGSPSAAWR